MSESASSFEGGDSYSLAQHGYTIVHNYALYFWRPYLGNTAFALWELLLSFCYGDRDTAYPSISRLARILTNSDHSRAVVTGRRKAVRGAFPPDPPRYEGALGILLRERLVQVTRRGQGPTSSYTFRVCKSLPLLRPEQVARLSPSLQRDHANWLERYGIDAPACNQLVSPPVQEQPAALCTTPVAPSPTPDAGCSSRSASGNTGHASLITNNTKEETMMKNWWQEALNALRLQLTRSTFETCLLGTKVLSFRDGVLTVQAPGRLACEMLQHRLAPLIQRMLVAISDAQVQQVCFVNDRPGL